MIFLIIYASIADHFNLETSLFLSKWDFLCLLIASYMHASIDLQIICFHSRRVTQYSGIDC